MPRRNLTTARKGGQRPKLEDRPRKNSKGKSVIEVEIDPALNKGRRPSVEELEQRQDLAYKLRLLGKTPEEIGSSLGLSVRTVSGYLKEARDRQANEIKTLDGKCGVLRQFQVLNYVLEESLNAWERSKRISKKKQAGVQTKELTATVGSVGTETVRKTSQVETEKIGDPSYLDRAMKASEQIRLLLGLDAPEIKRLMVEASRTIEEDDAYLRTLPADQLFQRYREKIGLGESSRN